MDAFTKGQAPEVLANRDSAVQSKEFKTDVEGIFANDTKQGMAVFDVDQDEFHQNMHFGRQRLRFKNGSNVSAYMKGTRYKIPFFIRNGDFLRKVR